MKEPTTQDLADRLNFSHQLLTTTAQAITDNSKFLPPGPDRDALEQTGQTLLAIASQHQELARKLQITAQHQRLAKQLGIIPPRGRQRQPSAAIDFPPEKGKNA